VIWVWAPNRIDKLLTASRQPAFLAALYPGDDYVDWVGMSGYSRPPYGANATFSFDETYGKTLQQLRGLTAKPILLAEVGASEIEGHKPTWVRNFFQGLAAPQNADIVGFSWFSLAITTYIEGERGTNDWRIDSRGDSLAAFREGLLAPGSRYGPG
jgi:beta-mannanase